MSKSRAEVADDILMRIALRYRNCFVHIYDVPELTPVEGVLRCAAEEGFVLVPTPATSCPHGHPDKGLTCGAECETCPTCGHPVSEVYRGICLSMTDGSTDVACGCRAIGPDGKYLESGALMDELRAVREALQWCLNHTKGHEVSCNLNQQDRWDEAQQALSDCASTPEVRGEGEATSIAQAEINVKRNQCTCGYWDGLKRAEAALFQPVPAEGAQAWLIERPGPEWATCWSGGFEWTKDSLKAIRFCRREDANQVAELFEFEDVRITEHTWE
jgi:hypothetical protein